MKRIFVLFLALVLCLSLCACGKSDAVKAAEEAIAAIGNVTADSGDAIEKAERLYDILSDAEKEKVENRQTLADAKVTYQEAVKAEKLALLKSVYDDLKSAYEIVDCYGTDIKTAWNLGIYQKDRFQGSNLNGAMEYLASNVQLDYDSLVEGATYAYMTIFLDSDWDNLSEEVKQKNRDAIATGTFFYFCGAEGAQVACVCSVVDGYLLNGSVEKVNAALDNFSAQKSAFSGDKDCAAEIEKMDELYAVLESFVSFCQSPTGNYNEACNTMEDYRRTAEDCLAAIDDLFE